MKRLLVCVVLLVGMGVASAAELFTNVYVVPPTFLNTGNDGASAAADPFATDAVAVRKRLTAKEILENAGITFGSGMSAIYNPSTSQLIIRNTQDQMELVEAYIDSIVTRVEKQIYVTFRDIAFDASAREKWDVGGFPNIFEIPENSRVPNNSWSGILDSKAALVEVLRQEPTEFPSSKSAISGVFTDPQFQLMIRHLRELKGVDLTSPPSVMCRSGQAGYSQLGNNRYGVVPVLGADEFTVDLSLYFPSPGGTLAKEGEVPNRTVLNLTIWDGQTVAITEKNEDGSGRIIFARAQIMDPAGMPINKMPSAAAKKTPNELTEEEKGEVTKADEAALRGSQLLADGKMKEASENYTLALKLLPDHPMTEPRRQAYQTQFDRAEREPKESQVDLPTERSAVHIVKKGETIYQIAKEREISINQLKEFNGLASDVLIVGQLLRFPGEKAIGNELLPDRDLDDLLKETILPKINFDDTPLTIALAHFIGELDRLSATGKVSDSLPKILIADAEEASDIRITLRLRNVPAIEALRYITALSQRKYRIEGKTIHIEGLDK